MEQYGGLTNTLITNYPMFPWENGPITDFQNEVATLLQKLFQGIESKLFSRYNNSLYLLTIVATLIIP